MEIRYIVDNTAGAFQSFMCSHHSKFKKIVGQNTFPILLINVEDMKILGNIKEIDVHCVTYVNAAVVLGWKPG